jgi:hypothetical protein
MGCTVCGEEDCVRHGSVPALAQLLNVCALAGAALLIGLMAVALAAARA